LTPAVNKDEITYILPKHSCHLNPHLIPQTALYPKITPYIPDCGLQKITYFWIVDWRLRLRILKLKLLTAQNFGLSNWLSFKSSN